METPDDRLRALTRFAQNEDALAELAEVAAESWGRAALAPGFLLCLAPQPSLPKPKYITAFAEAFHLDEYTANQRLLSAFPRVMKRFETAEKVAHWVDWLATIRIAAFNASEAVIGVQTFAGCDAVYATEEFLTGEDSAKGRLEAPWGDVVCLVLGEVRERHVTEIQQRQMKTDLTVDRHAHAHTTEVILDLHLRGAQPTLRFSDATFRFNQIMPDVEGPSAMRLRKLASRLLKRCANVPLMDSFDAAAGALGSTSDILHSSSWLKRNYLGAGGHVRAVSGTTRLESNRRAFDLFSTLCRLQRIKP